MATGYQWLNATQQASTAISTDSDISTTSGGADNVELTRRDEDDAVVIAVQGDLDIATADQLFRKGQHLLAERPSRTLILDLADLQFLDSSGIGTLVELRNVAAENSSRLQLRHPTDRTRRLLEITALNAVFDIQP